MAVGRGCEDQRHPLAQERVGRPESAGSTVAARRVVAVVAQVRRDEHEVRRAPGGREIVPQACEADDVRRARGRIDDRVKVHERVVARRVLVAARHRSRRRLGVLGRVPGIECRVRASGRLATQVVAHVLQVAAPGPPDLRQLVGQRAYRRRIDATVADRLPVGRCAGGNEVGEYVAIRARLGRAGLAADHGEVVAEAEVRRAVVLLEQNTPGGQRSREVWCRRPRSEAFLVALVLEHDDEYVTDGRGGAPARVGRRRAKCGLRDRCGGPKRDEESQQKRSDHRHSTCTPIAPRGPAIWRQAVTMTAFCFNNLRDESQVSSRAAAPVSRMATLPAGARPERRAGRCAREPRLRSRYA